MPTPDEIARQLFNKTTKGIKLGLERVRQAAALIGDPQTAYASVHIAGTNGKGSTCAYIESVMRAHGAKTGLFTSPHLVRFEERFIIGGRPISGEQWMRVYNDLAEVIETSQLTFFEAITLIAFELFKREKVEWAIIETGMGGRLDATNIVIPRVTAITSLGLDHMQYLGNDLVSIAREKLGIVKQGVPLVIARPGQIDVEAVIKQQCKSMEAPCTFVAADDATNIETSDKGTCFSIGNRTLTTSLIGEYQIQNTLIALKALEYAGFIGAAKTADGIAHTLVPGRFQIINVDDRIVIFDVGHNPAAAEAFVTALMRRFRDTPACMVVGVMKDKDIAGVLRQYCSTAKRLILTKPKIERAADCETLLSKVPSDYTGICSCIPAVSDAVKSALTGDEKIVCFVGSFYTVGEAMKTLGIEPY
jgi:dihydrofolate synthase / folylpolyglutamate synthase